MSDDTKALVERAREVAGYKYQHHTIHVPVVLNLLADTIERLERELSEARGVSLAYTLSLSSLEGRCNDLLDELSALARERDALASKNGDLRMTLQAMLSLERVRDDDDHDLNVVRSHARAILSTP